MSRNELNYGTGFIIFGSLFCFWFGLNLGFTFSLFLSVFIGVFVFLIILRKYEKKFEDYFMNFKNRNSFIDYDFSLVLSSHDYTKSYSGVGLGSSIGGVSLGAGTFQENKKLEKQKKDKYQIKIKDTGLLFIGDKLKSFEVKYKNILELINTNENKNLLIIKILNKDAIYLESEDLKPENDVRLLEFIIKRYT